MRVATAEIELTSDRVEAEKGADVRVVATHAVQRAAAKAKKGDFKEAQLQMRAAQRFVARTGDDAQLDAWSSNVAAMDDVLNSDGTEAAAAPPAPNNNNDNNEKKSYKPRSKKKNDNTATKISKMANVDQSSLF